MLICPFLGFFVLRRSGNVVKVILVVTIVLTPVDGSQLQHPEAGCGAQAGRGASPLGRLSGAAGGHLRIGGRGGRREREEGRGRQLRRGLDVVEVVLVLANVLAVVDGAELEDSEAGWGADGGPSGSGWALGD